MSFFLNFHILSPRRNFVIENKSDFFLQILFRNQFNLNSLTTKKQTPKFSSANFEKKKLLSPSYIILRIQRLEDKQCRSR